MFLYRINQSLSHDSIISKKRKWILKEKRPVVTMARIHDKTIVFRVLSTNGEQFFRQHERDLTVNRL